MSQTMAIEKRVHFHIRGRGRKDMCLGVEPAAPLTPSASVPRVARLLALAIRCATLVRTEEVADYAELARLAHVTRARITQILNLLHLAPDIQEELLFLQGKPRGRGAILLAHLQPIAAIPDWRRQRRRWQALKRARATE
jgi:hypothetical protein